jgi:hypothetical protein
MRGQYLRTCVQLAINLAIEIRAMKNGFENPIERCHTEHCQLILHVVHYCIGSLKSIGTLPTLITI